jgi:tripartite-type tricarboxylate transporter receptor subunit TctC
MRISIGIIATLLSLILGSPCHAQTWPDHHVSLIVPFAAGSAIDVVARIVSAEMSQHLGQPIIVENISGAGGTQGVDHVAKAAPDGYQIVLGALDTFAQARFLYTEPKYDSVKDFAPVALVADQSLLLTVRSTLPVQNVEEFVDYTRKNHAKMQFGSGGIGAGPYLACALVNQAIGVEVTHVPYRGSAAALQDMVAGTLDYYCPLAPAAMALMANNSIKALAVLTESRSGLLPNLPTAKEQGLPVTGGYAWFAIFAPKGTPDGIVQKLNAAIVATLDNPIIQDRLKTVGAIAVNPDRRSNEYLASYLNKEIEKWGPIIKASGIQPQ